MSAELVRARIEEGPEAASHLVHDFEYGAFVGDAAADAFRHEFFEVVFRILEVAVFGALLHRLQGTHAAVGFESAPFVYDGFAWALFGAREHGADHHGICASGDAFDAPK